MKPVIPVLLGSTVYATVRYNVCKGVPWSDWPTYTLNKVLALSALILLATAVTRQSRGVQADAKDKTLSMAGLFAFMHGFLSLVLFSPVYYEKFFSQGRLTWVASWSMLLGVAAAGIMKGGLKTSEGRNREQEVKKLALLAFLIGIHAMLPGYSGWFTPSKWPGGMPPITLITFVFSMIALIAGFFPKKPTCA